MLTSIILSHSSWCKFLIKLSGITPALLIKQSVGLPNSLSACWTNDETCSRLVTSVTLKVAFPLPEELILSTNSFNFSSLLAPKQTIKNNNSIN